MALLAVDAGRSEVEVKSKKGLFVFPSAVSPAGKQEIPAHRKGDLELHMNGEKWWVGNLAEREGKRWKMNNFGESKVHEILKVQVVAGAIYSGMSTGEEIDLGILVPINAFTKEERHKLIDLLEGEYDVTYWLVTEAKQEPKKRVCTLKITSNILISQEGSAAYWSDPQDEDTQTLDFGAQTVNYCYHEVIEGEREFINDLSGTIDDGWEILKKKNPTMSVDNLAKILVRSTLDKVSHEGWKKNLKTQVFGGIADIVYPYIKEEFPRAELADDPRNGNVNGLYKLMEEVMVGV